MLSKVAMLTGRRSGPTLGYICGKATQRSGEKMVSFSHLLWDNYLGTDLSLSSDYKLLFPIGAK